MREAGRNTLSDFLEPSALHDPEVNSFVAASLPEVRRRGIEAAPNAPLDFARRRPSLSNLPEAFKTNRAEDAIQLGRKLVDAIVTTQVGKTCLQLSLPTVDVAGLQSFCGGEAVDGEPMSRSLLTLVWAVHDATRDAGERPRLVQEVFAHKSEERNIDELHWWSRCCNSDVRRQP